MPHFVLSCGLITMCNVITKVFMKTFKIFPIMLALCLSDAFKDLICLELCWHNRPGSIKLVTHCVL